MSIRAKLFLVSVVLIGAVGLLSGLFLEDRLHGWILDRVEQELTRHAHTVRVAVEGLPAVGAVRDTDAFTDAVGAAIGARVTVVDDQGHVLGDSSLDPQAVASAEDHGTRPEIIEARARGVGTALRQSATTGVQMLYVAVPFQREGGPGVVRVAMPLSDVESMMWRLRLTLAVTGLLGLAAALLMSGVASHLMSRTLRELVDRAHALSAGMASRAPSQVPAPTDELGGLAGSLNRMAIELERSVNSMADERDRFQNVLDGLSEAVIALDGDQKITLVNRATTDMLGLTAPPMGQTLLETARIAALGDLAAKLRTGEPGEAEFDLPSQPGEPVRRVLARATLLRAVTGAVVVLHDVTEIRRLESVRRDFVANVSHELRTPVSIIRANAETLLDGALDDKERSREFVDAMLRHADRLARLIADLLDLSRIEAGRFPIKPTRIRTAAALRRSIDMVERSAREKGLSIELIASAELALHADPRALDQVVANLLDNAVKYTPAGGHIVVRAMAAERHRVRVEIADDGPGIDARHRERVFERFYRVDPGRSRDVGGTGLGLSIVKHLVEVMGGDVGLEPAAPHGSVFWFTLPTPEVEQQRDAA